MKNDLNKKRFSEFTDNKKKIVPGVRDDWTVNHTIKPGHIIIKSKTGGISFNVSTKTFFEDLDTYKISLIGREIQDMITFDHNRRIVPAEEYNSWVDNQRKNELDVIKNKDLEVGSIYFSEDNTKVIYLGSKYVSKVKYISPTSKFYTTDGKSPMDDLNEPFYLIRHENHIPGISSVKYVEVYNQKLAEVVSNEPILDKTLISKAINGDHFDKIDYPVEKLFLLELRLCQ